MFDWEIIDFLALYMFSLKVILIAVAVMIVISSLDDVIFDLLYWGRVFYKHFIIRKQHKPLDVEKLYLVRQKPFAIMVPAWQESEVIAQMVENTIKTYDYKNYHIFIGAYRNDPATQEEVKKLELKYDNVHLVTVPQDGPTCKADCLNWVIQGVKLLEQKSGVPFEAIVMHDAEDVVHRLELLLFNFLVDRKDLMQLPVFSLERPWYEFVAGHYIDEFAEAHSKDLLVREMLTDSVPSAGVATCFSKRAIDALSSDGNFIFNTDSLTEDYDISFRLKKFGLKQIFLRYGVMATKRVSSPFTGRVKEVRKVDYVATREYFPNKVNTSVRQKSRWVLGIVFQGWKFIGWRGNVFTRYVLFRDRKSVISSFVTFAAYFVSFNVLAFSVAHRLFSNSYSFPPLVIVHTFPWWLVMLNLGFFINRLLHRMLFTGLIYGWEQALLSIPRLFVGNFINFLASCRAIKLFTVHIITGKKLVWDKTDHVYPSTEQLKQMKQRLGEILLERRIITQSVLEQALYIQKQRKIPLGEILLEMEAITVGELAPVLSSQTGVSIAESITNLRRVASIS